MRPEYAADSRFRKRFARRCTRPHVRNVAKAFAEAIPALSAAADVNVPDAGSVFDDHD